MKKVLSIGLLLSGSIFAMDKPLLGEDGLAASMISVYRTGPGDEDALAETLRDAIGTSVNNFKRGISEASEANQKLDDEIVEPLEAKIVNVSELAAAVAEKLGGLRQRSVEKNPLAVRVQKRVDVVPTNKEYAEKYIYPWSTSLRQRAQSSRSSCTAGTLYAAMFFAGLGETLMIPFRRPASDIIVVRSEVEAQKIIEPRKDV